MTSLFNDPAAFQLEQVELEARLCADGTSTLLESPQVADPDGLVELVLGRHGLPEAVLRDEHDGSLAPLGWVVAAPGSPASVGRVLDTPMGPLRTPDAYVELRPVVRGIGFEAIPVLPRMLESPRLTELLGSAGLLDAADQHVAALWEQYRAAVHGDGPPQERFDAMLSVHTRARSCGVLQLAAHAADNAGDVLHRTGAFDGAIALHRWAIGVYSREWMPEDWSMALTNLAHALWHDGQLAAAAAAGAEACELARSLTEPARSQRGEHAATIVAYAYADVGRVADADASLRGLRAPRETLARGWWHHVHAHVALAAGRLSEASGHLTAAVTAAYEADGRPDRGDSLLAETFALTAALARARGDEAGAVTADANAGAARRRMPAPYTH